MGHPSEERLLEIADLGLEDDHVRRCAECARAVEEQRGARAALRTAPLLELPGERVQGYVATLPEQTRVRRLRGWPQRLAVLAPIGAAAIAVVAISTRGEDLPRPAADDAGIAMSTPDQEGARAGAELQAAPPRRACPTPEASLQKPVATVQGPPDDVVALLRAAGVDAVRCGRAVEVPGLETGRVLELLADRPDGDVEVRTAR